MATTTPMHDHKPTVADTLLQALDEAGVDYIFAVYGSDHPSIIEAYAGRQLRDLYRPEILLFQHEFVAISAADGYARATGKAQCVLVHVDVGTAALGQGLHTASSGKAPMLIIAGQAPSTLHGELPGSRSEHVQWYQDVPDQASIVRPFARYTNEIKCGEHVKIMVNRAILMASTGARGPSYLTATREVLASPFPAETGLKQKIRPSYHLGGLSEDAVRSIGSALLEAQNPLVVTGYLGRNAAAVTELVQLVDQVKGLRVFDFEAREMSFPANHPAWLCRSTGAALAIREADVVLILDADVPWIPTKVSPNASARIFHIDVDPRKEFMQLFDVFAEASFAAESELALRQLNAFVHSSPRFEKLKPVFTERQAALEKAHEDGLRMLVTKAMVPDDDSISVNHLFAKVRVCLPPDTVYVHDVVTNQVPLTEQLQSSKPGTNLSKGSSGLGWAGGAALGVTLAMKKYHIDRKPQLTPRSESGSSTIPMVCSLTGDGAFVFGSPSAVYWAQQKHKTPFLTIIVNNGGWRATRACLKDVHADGSAASMSDAQLGIDLSNDGPDYLGIAIAASNHKLWGRRVRHTTALESALAEAVEQVTKYGKAALLEVIVS